MRSNTLQQYISLSAMLFVGGSLSLVGTSGPVQYRILLWKKVLCVRRQHVNTKLLLYISGPRGERERERPTDRQDSQTQMCVEAGRERVPARTNTGRQSIHERPYWFLFVLCTPVIGLGWEKKLSRLISSRPGHEPTVVERSRTAHVTLLATNGLAHERLSPARYMNVSICLLYVVYDAYNAQSAKCPRQPTYHKTRTI